MRQAINENRNVQLALLGLLALVGAFILLVGRGGGGSAETTTTAPAPAPTTAPSQAPTATPAPGATAPATSGAPVDSSGAAPAAGSASAVPVSLIPGPGLPKGLLSAYHHGDAIVLLVRRAGGIDDALVDDSVRLVSALPDVKVYVTKAQHVARYAWLTQGVDLSDLPALVILRPRNLTKGTPVATVNYGYRDGASVVQAVRDALYRGPADRPYHP
jgi:hypothetical protein